MSTERPDTIGSHPNGKEAVEEDVDRPLKKLREAPATLKTKKVAVTIIEERAMTGKQVAAKRNRRRDSSPYSDPELSDDDDNGVVVMLLGSCGEPTPCNFRGAPKIEDREVQIYGGEDEGKSHISVQDPRTDSSALSRGTGIDCTEGKKTCKEITDDSRLIPRCVNAKNR
ncbi:unnamed protein product [Cuscuta campestris]|uniref:Uncharacterized protein n=1 Tax=Cuscuta campestris TaxID=132261 RepID=A0A484NEK2_9ASTE|nr:unnamed protein product [Cuscuta campestris]